ncbi:uncharacterized protein LOC120634664 [Pararge aegeria]|uniref:uncharacterized protein LOC120634664 n=1 Tax=Pararge aegeria TaxID=116150 RepID=UPI0019D0A055|nr:uncharacterized protein LOC120634664 [Pararge aegeria]XP_039761337.1 uncharacterized protein LOC120634664 [Pararge aegeria]
MATSKPGTSHTIDPLLLDKEGDFKGYGKETYTLLKYILRELAEEKGNATKCNKDEDPLQRAQRYTGLHMNTLKKLSDGLITVDELTEVSRKCVYDALMSFYLDKNIMPTATELFDSVQDFLPPYEDIRSFKKKLVKMGYIFKKRENCFIIYEKPSIRFERFLYLKHIIQYRKDKRPIYYISEVSLSYKKVWNIDESVSDKHKTQIHLLFAVSSHKGVQFLKRVNKLDTEIFNSWLLNDVMPNLETNSVVILDNTELHCDTYCETPNKNSPNHVLIEWLAFHEIPFIKTMSIVELNALVNKYTDRNVRLYKPDIWLKQNGHDVLRLPDCLNEMTPAAHTRHVINKKIKLKDDLDLKGIENDVNESELTSYSSMLFAEEERLFGLEMKLDVVFDNLMPSIYCENDLYLPSISDSDS